MEDLEVTVERVGTEMNRLLISYKGQVIGEYEKSKDTEVARKKREIELALPLLLEVHRQHGEFAVRWQRPVKSVRVESVEVAQIPRMCWVKPSWAK